MTRYLQPPSTWNDRAVVCIGSGPSLTPEDVEAVRLSGLPVVAVNSTWEAVPFCDVVFAGDHVWWKHNNTRINIPAERWSCLEQVERDFGANRHGQFRFVTNSGSRAVEFIIDQKPARVILLGFDCSLKGGSHHHGDHKTTDNPRQSTCDRWVNKHFPDVAKLAAKRGVQVLNCSRRTALQCFPLVPLAEALAYESDL